MVDLFMGLVLAGFTSGFLAWAGLLGSGKEFGELMFFVLPALALAIVVLALAESLHGLVRARRFGRATNARA